MIKTKTLFHGHSFTANPLACTAALASLQLIQKKRCRQRVAQIVSAHETFAKRIEKFNEDRPGATSRATIENIRHLGTIMAFEIHTPESDGYLHNIGADFTKFCLKRNVYLRSLGNTIYIMPPYCITKKQLKKIYKTVEEFLETMITV